MSNVAIITASIRCRDTIEESYIFPDSFKTFDFHCFVEKGGENRVKGGLWNIHYAEPFSSVDLRFKNRRDAKVYKILPQLFLTNYDYYVWCDPTHVLYKDPREVLQNKDFAFFKHKLRENSYDEIQELLKYTGYEYHEVLHTQSEYYRSVGYNGDNGLYECPILISKNNNNALKFRLMWWEHICRFSSRDQISAPFCAALSKLNYTVVNENIQDIIPMKSNKIAQKFKPHNV